MSARHLAHPSVDRPRRARGVAAFVAILTLVFGALGWGAVPAMAAAAPPTSAQVDQSTGATVTGNAAASVTITAKDPRGNVLGTGTARGDGTFTVQLNPAQYNGELVSVTANDGTGESQPLQAQAPDRSAPDAPVNLRVGADGNTVTGQAEVGSSITVFDIEGRTIGTGLTDTTGKFTVSLSPRMANGEQLAVRATDGVGLSSPDAHVMAPDLTPPDTPEGFVSRDGTEMFVKSEPNSKILVKDPRGNVIGMGTADSRGEALITLSPFQRNGDVLALTATDAAGNVSVPASVFSPLYEKTPLTAEVNQIDGATVSGTTSPGASVRVYAPDGTLLGRLTADDTGAWSLALSPAYTAGETLTVKASEEYAWPADDVMPVAPTLTEPTEPTDPDDSAAANATANADDATANADGGTANDSAAANADGGVDQGAGANADGTDAGSADASGTDEGSAEASGADGAAAEADASGADADAETGDNGAANADASDANADGAADGDTETPIPSTEDGGVVNPTDSAGPGDPGPSADPTQDVTAPGGTDADGSTPTEPTPTEPATTDPATAGTPSHRPGAGLANTGFGGTQVALAALALLTIGGATLLIRRRRA